VTLQRRHRSGVRVEHQLGVKAFAQPRRSAKVTTRFGDRREAAPISEAAHPRDDPAAVSVDDDGRLVCSDRPRDHARRPESLTGLGDGDDQPRNPRRRQSSDQTCDCLG
jgi:hypothetical protein